MPRPTYQDLIKLIPTHTVAMPVESQVPSRHYQRSANDAWNLLTYDLPSLFTVAPIKRNHMSDGISGGTVLRRNLGIVDSSFSLNTPSRSAGAS